MARALTNDEFIKLANLVHNNKYNYVLSAYTNSGTTVIITCPIHGNFRQIPHGHLTGRGCKQCSLIKRSKSKTGNSETFIAKAKKKHGNEYNYEKTKYIKHDKKVIITCRIHGDFKQTPNNHLSYGCNSCAKNKRGILKRKTLQDFIKRANIIHMGKYNYSNSEYAGSRNKITISCKKHGEFNQMVCNHLSGNGCPKCKTSKGQNEIEEFIRSIGVADLTINTRKIISPMEIDVYSPSLKIGIEFCGLYWHSEENGKTANYHRDKQKACDNIGVKLVTIFEDEWKNSRTKVENELRRVFSTNNNNKSVVKIDVNDIEWKVAKEFLDTYHILSAGRPGEHKVGAFSSDGKIIGATVFNTNSSSGIMEMTRSYVLGGNLFIMKRMFDYAISTYGFSKVSAYADPRWHVAPDREYLGFEVVGESAPTLFWTDNKERFTRRFKSKKELVESGADTKLSKAQILNNMGYSRIWDCGKIKMEWSLK